MTDRSFDKFIKDSLDNYSTPVGEEMWEKIQAENEKKVEGRFWWKNYGFVSLVGVAAIISASIIFLNRTQEPSTYRTQKSSITQNPLVQDGSLDLENPPSIAGANKTASKSSIDTKTPDTKSSSNNDNATVRSKVENDFSGNSSALYNINIKNSSTASGIRKPRKESIVSLENNLEIKGASNNISKKEPSSTQSTYKAVLLTTALQDKNLNDYTINQQLLKGLKPVNSFCLDGCPSAFPPKRSDVHVEIYASPDFARKTINNSGGVDDVFLNRKDSTERMRLSFSAGFRLSKTLANNVVLKTGLQFSQINEKFSYRSENERKQTTVITIRKEVLSTGDTAMIRDTSVIEQVGYRVKTTYNRYRSIDIPLIAGYEWGNNDLKAAISAGVILNVFSWQKGEGLDTSYVPVAFNQDGGRTFKRNIGLGLFTGFSVLKRVGESSYIFAEPYFRYNVSNITNSKSLFNQKFDVTGVNFGVRYKLNTGQRYFGR